MRAVRKVTLTWDEISPEYFSVCYVNNDGVEHRKQIHREMEESVHHFLERVGRTCISAAKGDLT